MIPFLPKRQLFNSIITLAFAWAGTSLSVQKRYRRMRQALALVAWKCDVTMSSQKQGGVKRCISFTALHPGGVTQWHRPWPSVVILVAILWLYLWLYCGCRILRSPWWLFPILPEKDGLQSSESPCHQGPK